MDKGDGWFILFFNKTVLPTASDIPSHIYINYKFWAIRILILGERGENPLNMKLNSSFSLKLLELFKKKDVFKLWIAFSFPAFAL